VRALGLRVKDLDMVFSAMVWGFEFRVLEFGV